MRFVKYGRRLPLCAEQVQEKKKQTNLLEEHRAPSYSLYIGIESDNENSTTQRQREISSPRVAHFSLSFPLAMTCLNKPVRASEAAGETFEFQISKCGKWLGEGYYSAQTSGERVLEGRVYITGGPRYLLCGARAIFYSGWMGDWWKVHLREDGGWRLKVCGKNFFMRVVVVRGTSFQRFIVFWLGWFLWCFIILNVVKGVYRVRAPEYGPCDISKLTRPYSSVL